MPITIEARRDFVQGVVPLSLWLARKLAREGMALEEALTARSYIYRLTTLWDGKNHPARPAPGWRDERWEGILKELHSIYERHANDAGTAALEADGYALLRPILEPRLEKDVKEWPRPQDRPFGFFTYNPAKDEAARRIDLHLANPFAPKSPFDDLPARAGELSRLLDDAQAKVSGLRTVACGSWLNSLKPFADLFPPEWAASASAPGPLNFSNGWWGQVVDRTGGYHRKNGERLRTTGAFPYPSVSCKCALDALRAHLKKNLGV